MIGTEKHNSASWFVHQRKNRQADIRLFCFPYAGGGASVFYGWPDLIDKAIDVIAVQLPGRENRFKEPLLTRISDVVEALVPVLSPYLDRPFAFFGHSMGAIIGYEMIRCIMDRYGRNPLHLFVSGHSAPFVPETKTPIHTLPDQDFIDEIRRYNGIPEAVLDHTELMDLLLPILRADFKAVETYRFRASSPLVCPISAFGGVNDVDVARDHLEAWKDLTKGKFNIHMFPGGHFFIHSQRRTLVNLISRHLRPSIVANGQGSAGDLQPQQGFKYR